MNLEDARWLVEYQCGDVWVPIRSETSEGAIQAQYGLCVADDPAGLYRITPTSRPV